ncbi:MAG: hypothetical protein RIR11_3696 [Bacteroidota bacterium]|jgi:photosystem II stability/assembly factor-like uncharacterized protein
MKHLYLLLLFIAACIPTWNPIQAQTTLTPTETGVNWRNVGPFRGGRSAAVTGVAGQPNLFYFGGTGGGVWRTQDGGRSWECISDGFFGGSIGAIEVAPSDHNVIYVGGGEVTVRGNVSYGTGMWKSDDAGRTWKSIGLKNSRHIPRLRVHPTNSDIVYAAVMGDLFKDSNDRGVYRSKDGGKNWEKVLFVNSAAGAVDLAMDPTNPRILYASTWRIRRNPHSLSSGGEGSSLWKSTDGGDSWVELIKNEGMTKDTIGIIGVAVSAVRPDRVFAIVESKTGGVFRSDDGGKTWKKTNDDRNLRQRAWYYSRIYTDTEDEDVVYVMNVSYHKSKDGGKTFSRKNAQHGDHHDLWVAPEDPRRMIIADDGGAQVTYDGGETWTTYHNQPTAQFYRVTTDNAFPFRIYAAQQDNSSVRIEHRTNGGSIGDRDFESTAGGESGHIAVDPSNPDIVYGGEYHGFLSRYDHANKSQRAINVWPEDNMGHGAEDAKYRFQWNFPLFFSPHNPKKLYACSNNLHVTTDEGQTWTVISPDLTTNDKSRQKSSGGPITQDNTSVEYYCTIFAAAESPRVRDLIWTGSDDGLVNVTRDGGKTWNNVTPPSLPRWTMINCIEPDPFNDGGCYLAATSYKLGDYKPYLCYTSDYGVTWKQITNGIGEEHFTRVIRADQKVKGLLYAGTEQGMYYSSDNGANWKTMQLNLPIVPVTDLTIKENKLIAATQGRALWMIDDLNPIQQLASETQSNANIRLFTPAETYRMGGYSGGKSKFAGENHPNGVMVHFWIKDLPNEKDTIALAFYDADNKLVRRYTNKTDDAKLDLKKGGNRFVWDMTYPPAEKFDGMVLWSYDLEGPKAVPGNYTVRLETKAETLNAPFKIVPDKRSKSTPADFKRQLDFVQSVGEKITKAHRAIKDIRDVRAQLAVLKEKTDKKAEFKALTDLMAKTDSVMTSVEKAIYQTQNRSSQDPLNFPVRLNDKLANLMGLNAQSDYPPTQQSLEVREMLFRLTDEQLAKWELIKKDNLPEINRLFRSLGVDLLKTKF